VALFFGVLAQRLAFNKPQDSRGVKLYAFLVVLLLAAQTERRAPSRLVETGSVRAGTVPGVPNQANTAFLLLHFCFETVALLA